MPTAAAFSDIRQAQLTMDLSDFLGFAWDPNPNWNSNLPNPNLPDPKFLTLTA